MFPMYYSLSINILFLYYGKLYGKLYGKFLGLLYQIWETHLYRAPSLKIQEGAQSLQLLVEQGSMGLRKRIIYKMSSQDSYAAYKKRKYLSRVATKKRVKPTYMFSKNPLYRSLQNRGTHTITKCASLKMLAHNTGYSFDIGTIFSQNFAIWFTQQDVYIWANASNYSIVSIPGYSDIAALFDEVMIYKIEMTIFTGTDPTTSANGSGQIILARDYNDKVAPASVGDVQQYADVKAFNMANNFINRFNIYPKFLTYSLDAAGTSTASTPKRGYCRSNLTTDHYGIKGSFINTPPNSQNHTYQFKFIYKCKVAK